MLRKKASATNKWSKPVVIRFHKSFDMDLRRYCADKETRVATFLREIIEKRLTTKLTKHKAKI